jgi:metallophosphoesterase (TIGR00282 family)
MNILFIGDIFGSPGRRIVADHLQDIVQANSIDLTIANAENAAGGFGITPSIAEELFGLGLDVLTSGNHVWDKRELFDYFARQPRLLRPANYPEAPGRGAITYRARNGAECAVINLQGRTYMPATDCPFRKADQLLNELDPGVKVRFVDFHAEVTSEKMAMGWYLDGRVSAVIGTHTHVPTADEQVLPGGTAYITDVGMTGPHDSVIGMEKGAVIKRFLDGMPARFEVASGDIQMNAVLMEVDSISGRAVSIGRRRYRLEH